mgnify:CR=1|tara:strand:- start:113 stop:250 length:138 start_codon:yes stop_codon:yes gene_type:complete
MTIGSPMILRLDLQRLLGLGGFIFNLALRFGCVDLGILKSPSIFK